MIKVLAIASDDSMVGSFIIGFLVAEVSGADISKVYAVKRNCGDAYGFAANVTADTPVLSRPIQELYQELVAGGHLQPQD